MPNEIKLTIQGPMGDLEAVETQIENANGDDFAIVCHPHPLFDGTMHNKVVNTFARIFRDLGIPSVRFNFRGVGQSEGTYGEGLGETDDLLAVLKHYHKPNRRIWLAGFSFGSFVAANGCLQWLKQHPNSIQHLVLAAPAVENFEFDGLFPMDVKTTVIIPTEDEVVDPQAQYLWLDQQLPPLDLMEIEGSSHFFHGKLVELKQRLTDILKEDHPAILNSKN